ncbi:MAG: beta-mannosidase [Pedobacter sp.]|nr:MAG: beta-mannosidase [Pedobacter sp.]
MTAKLLLKLTPLVAGALCLLFFDAAAQNITLIDPLATKETKALYSNLYKLSENHTLFGHQHATEYGHGWSGEKNRSDVKSVVGSHPAVIGVDLAELSGRPAAEMRKAKEKLKQNVVDTYNRGGITTVAWHFSNPVSAGDFYWKDSVSLPAVKYIIPGGNAHEKYKAILDNVADWAKNLKGKNGALVPVIFRPYHEFDGDWFWWGNAHCTPEEFKTLWKFTVGYLRDTANVHNFIYAFSPDNIFTTPEKYMERYPGNEWVDMLGTDNYGDMGRYGKYNLESAVKKLQIVSELARKNNKIAAFTETGLESMPNTSWWNDVLLKVMKSEGVRMAYVLVWRNDTSSPTHYYAPFPGHPAVPDFKKFYDDPYTLFEKDLKSIYK